MTTRSSFQGTNTDEWMYVRDAQAELIAYKTMADTDLTQDEYVREQLNELIPRIDNILQQTGLGVANAAQLHSWKMEAIDGTGWVNPVDRMEIDLPPRLSPLTEKASSSLDKQPEPLHDTRKVKKMRITHQGRDVRTIPLPRRAEWDPREALIPAPRGIPYVGRGYGIPLRDEMKPLAAVCYALFATTTLGERLMVPFDPNDRHFCDQNYPNRTMILTAEQYLSAILLDPLCREGFVSQRDFETFITVSFGHTPSPSEFVRTLVESFPERVHASVSNSGEPYTPKFCTRYHIDLGNDVFPAPSIKITRVSDRPGYRAHFDLKAIVGYSQNEEFAAFSFERERTTIYAYVNDEPIIAHLAPGFYRGAEERYQTNRCLPEDDFFYEQPILVYERSETTIRPCANLQILLSCQDPRNIRDTLWAVDEFFPGFYNRVVTTIFPKCGKWKTSKIEEKIQRFKN